MKNVVIMGAAGASFNLLGPKETMIKSNHPLISVCTVRTACRKNQTSRKIALLLKAKGKRVVVIRHPVPYGDLVKQRVQRFSGYQDMIKQECTIEEMEEYEPLLKTNKNILRVTYELEEIGSPNLKEVLVQF